MPNDNQAGAKATVEIDGTKLDGPLETDLQLVVVDEHLHRPDMFLLQFADKDHDVIQQLGVKIGSKVKISGPSPSSGDTKVLLIDGEVTAIEAEYAGTSGSFAMVRGYDGSHRLHRGRVTQTYQNVTDDDIAKKVAQRAGLQLGTIQG